MESRQFFSRMLYDGETMENPKDDSRDVRDFPTGDITIELWIVQKGHLVGNTIIFVVAETVPGAQSFSMI